MMNCSGIQRAQLDSFSCKGFHAASSRHSEAGQCAGQVPSFDMKFLTDDVSVSFVRDLIDWSTTHAVLTQLVDPNEGVFLVGTTDLLVRRLSFFSRRMSIRLCFHVRIDRTSKPSFNTAGI